MKAKGPNLAFSSPSRPRRKNRRIVAPMPPATTKPAPSAPAATTGRWARSLPPISVASPRPVRRSSTASASWSRSVAISRRTSAVVRLFVAAIGPQRLRSQSGLFESLFGHRRRPLLDHAQSSQDKQEADKDERTKDDEQGCPRRHDERQRCRRRRQAEPEREEQEDARARDESDAHAESSDLSFELKRGKLQLETRERAGMLGNLLGRRPDAAVLSLAGGHVPSSR